MIDPEFYPILFDEKIFDADALKVIRRLKHHGYEAYLVGGCVRDLLLKERPKDFDIATNARPNQIRKVFRNCRIIGRRFRLAHILFAHQKIIEVATFRANAQADEQPNENTPADLLIVNDNTFGTAESDALRRDFTLNALFYDPYEGFVIDYVGGMKDIRKKLLVSIGDPHVRFQEDPVRIIRAIKFSSRLKLQLDEPVNDAIKSCHGELNKTSQSRLIEEVFKILNAKGVHDCFSNMQNMGVLQQILPFLSKECKKSDLGETFWQYLKAIDRYYELDKVPIKNRPPPPRSLQQPSRALLFALLIAPILHEDLNKIVNGNVQQSLRQQIHQKIQNIGTEMRCPKKDTYRAQQIFLAQERLYQGSRPVQYGNRVRRLSVKAFTSRGYFPESLQFMWLSGCAQSGFSHWEPYQSWRNWQNKMPTPSPTQKKKKKKGNHKGQRSKHPGQKFKRMKADFF